MTARKQTALALSLCLLTLSTTLPIPIAEGEVSTLENTKSVLETLIQRELNNGLGWVIEEDTNGRTVIHHQGGVTGFTSHMIGDKEARAGVYVMTNGSNRSAVVIANAAIKLLRGDPYTLPKERVFIRIDPVRMDRVLGTYVNMRTPGIHGPPEVVFTFENGRLVLTYGVDRMVYFDAESETRFYSHQVLMELTFEEAESGEIMSMHLVGDDYDLLARRVER